MCWQHCNEVCFSCHLSLPFSFGKGRHALLFFPLKKTDLDSAVFRQQSTYFCSATTWSDAILTRSEEENPFVCFLKDKSISRTNQALNQRVLPADCLQTPSVLCFVFRHFYTGAHLPSRVTASHVTVSWCCHMTVTGSAPRQVPLVSLSQF